MVTHHDVQQIARTTMDLARQHIRAGQTLASVREYCERSLRSLGADSFWYWDIGAFVFCGESTVESVSGRDYQTPDRVIQFNDIITVDLSPQRGGVWGDFARTILVQDGRALLDSHRTTNAEWSAGIQAQEFLHTQLLARAEPSMRFEELHTMMNRCIDELGFENLDFMGNLGHSIERDRDDRVYIEQGNSRRLADVQFFTFEPHIRRPGATVGFKHENIYYFEEDQLTEL
ncbi:M24 family metallopeptidase [Microbacterium sp. JAI119]|uniref:M24 family metallopeptidase n=1 Tax=Microbacterium sp. JAI119 TaxID=2723062 RepID=UPI0015CDAF4D|nr:M24 family metallopeptidase [Microbacterium sp. JAI119]NYF28089.1 Xaa-Pro aminopeptidase [Microbacterium sp. JAI119]